MSRSGPGPPRSATAVIALEIPRLLQEVGAQSPLDAPCGDWNWVRHVELGVERYVGVDIVEDLVRSNRERYSARGREFVVADLVAPEIVETPKITMFTGTILPEASAAPYPRTAAAGMKGRQA